VGPETKGSLICLTEEGSTGRGSPVARPGPPSTWCLSGRCPSPTDLSGLARTASRLHRTGLPQPARRRRTGAQVGAAQRHRRARRAVPDVTLVLIDRKQVSWHVARGRGHVCRQRRRPGLDVLGDLASRDGLAYTGSSPGRRKIVQRWVPFILCVDELVLLATVGTKIEQDESSTSPGTVARGRAPGSSWSRHARRQRTSCASLRISARPVCFPLHPDASSDIILGTAGPSRDTTPPTSTPKHAGSAGYCRAAHPGFKGAYSLTRHRQLVAKAKTISAAKPEGGPSAGAASDVDAALTPKAHPGLGVEPTPNTDLA